MVKLVAVRSTRMYGPIGKEGIFEVLNAVAYLIATVLLLGGLILLLPGFHLHNHPYTALIILSIALCIIILVNLHDLFAQAVGIDFYLRILAFDPQLAVVEFGVPIFHMIGGILLLIASITLIKRDTLDIGGRYEIALRLLIAGSSLWLLGSILNAFQVYERSSMAVQLCQKTVYIPMLMACTMYLISSIMWMKSWPEFVLMHSTEYTEAILAILASALLVIGAIANVYRVLYLKRLVEAEESSLTIAHAILERPRGRAALELERICGQLRQPLIGVIEQHEHSVPPPSLEPTTVAFEAPVPAPAPVPTPVPVLQVPAPTPSPPAAESPAVTSTPVEEGSFAIIS